MGALANPSSRKRTDRDYLSSIYRTQVLSVRRNLEVPLSKKARVSPLIPGTPYENSSSSESVSSRLSRYPAVTQPFDRAVHAPCRQDKFGLAAKKEIVNSSSAEKMGNFLGKGEPGNSGSGKKYVDYLATYQGAKKAACRSLRYILGGHEEEEAIGVDEECVRGTDDNGRADSGVEVVEVVEDGVVEEKDRLEKEGILARFNELDAKALTIEENRSSSSMAVSGWDVDASVPVHKKLLESANKRNGRLNQLQFEIKLEQQLLATLQLQRPAKKLEDEIIDPFVPLSKDEEAEVAHALSNASRWKVLVTHENSNIQITGELLQCLKPRAWLNDEVINVYLELLKERERREPKKFLKCHFFNTFFYKKLISGRTGYDYKSVRRWTTQRKLGYCLFDCDKIFVPVHKEVHWCLAVINKKDGMFQYLDSLGGVDKQVMKVLAQYFVDEVKDKNDRVFDVTSWKQEYVQDLPNQENGYDCGMFMIKYADFYSRDIGLCFKQEHMSYFRMRTAKEILRLRAD